MILTRLAPQMTPHFDYDFCVSDSFVVSFCSLKRNMNISSFQQLYLHVQTFVAEADSTCQQLLCPGLDCNSVTLKQVLSFYFVCLSSVKNAQLAVSSLYAKLAGFSFIFSKQTKECY